MGVESVATIYSGTRLSALESKLCLLIISDPG